MSKAGLDKIFEEFPSIKTERLSLREMNKSDVPAILTIFSDPGVTEFYDLFAFEERKQAADLLERWQQWFDDRKAIRWGITLIEEDVVIGTIGMRIQSEWKAALGYDLGSSFWRRGIMSEALDAVIRFAFDEVELERLEALVIPGNLASEVLLNKLGFTKEGLLRRYAYFKDAHHDLQCFSLLRVEYGD